MIADESSNALGLAVAGVGSWEALGWAGARHMFHAILDEALLEAGIGETRSAVPDSVLPDTIGPKIAKATSILSNHWARVTNCRYTVGNDTLVGLVAGAEQGWGVVVSAEPATIVSVATDCGREGRVTGCGSWFGEYGGAAEIVTKAGRCCRRMDINAAVTALEQPVCRTNRCARCHRFAGRSGT